MKIGILGTGIVGQTIGSKMIDLGHEVKLGSRTTNNDKAMDWVAKSGSGASAGTFSDAAAFGEMVILATYGAATIEILEMAGNQNFKGKTVIDLSNPLDFSKGFPPTLIAGLNNQTSLGEEVQKRLPDAFVVKTWNTMNCFLMVNPGLLEDQGDIFVSGNQAEAKATVVALLETIGWQSPIDLGDITSARATEQLVMLWVRIYGSYGHANFNFKIVK